MALLPAKRSHRILIVVAVLTAVGGSYWYQINRPITDPTLEGMAPRETPVQHNQSLDSDRSVFWGDLHIHTSFSSDAFTMGVRALPDDVYRFAKGETIHHGAGYHITIARPLDFAAVTDHAEYLGQARLSDLDVPTTRQALGDLLRTADRLSVTQSWWEIMSLIRDNGFKLTLDGSNADINRSAWQTIVDSAEEHNVPGSFTTFPAWEWSADAGDVGTHLHRNVIYGSDDVPALPFSALDGPTPPDLWRFLRAEREQGRSVLAIPHNPNLSEGLAYRVVDENGNRIPELSPADRSELEPISEILQIKGASETHPLLSSLDEFADFEIAGTVPGRPMTLENVKGGYARDALRTGISLSHSEGFNPLTFGVIGASDSHNASSPSEEWNYTGKLPMMDGSAGLRTGAAGLGLDKMTPARAWGSGGLAGVWAEANTRQALFAAMQRRETFATSGPRIVLRMFGDWGFELSDLATNDDLAKLESIGTPMGGELSGHPEEAQPTFLVFAERDPMSANLDRIQIIKGWVDNEGQNHERIIDVAWSGERIPDPKTGRVGPIGSTVDPAAASYSNSIGSPQLRGFWRDENFSPDQQAFYYARVLEIPTPRWSTYDAKRLGTEPMDPVSIQERAIGSAIWYQPAVGTSAEVNRQ